MTVLVVAEHNNQVLNESTLHCLTAAAQLDGDVHVLIAGFQCTKLIESLQECQPVKKILVADQAAYQHALPEAMAPLLQHLAQAYSHIIMPANGLGKNVLPRAAALCSAQPVTDVITIINKYSFKRPIYAGNAIATCEVNEAFRSQCLWLTVRPTAFDAVGSSETTGEATSEASQKVPHETVDFEPGEIRSSFIELKQEVSERPDLASAKIVISGGRGLQNADTFTKLAAIADRLNAALGASRAAVDAGLAPNDWQVGQTGKIVAPNLYIAIGISGAIQHIAGMKDSKVIVAINNDPDAPIFEVADYRLVDDLFTVLPELDQQLSALGY